MAKLLRRRTASYIAVFVLLMMLWELLSLALDLPFLPPPLEVVSNICSIFMPAISAHLLFSFIRILFGISVSLLFGAPIGLFMGYYKKLGRFLSPVIYFTYPIPKIALLPLVMIIFGLGEMSKVIVLTLIIVFQIIVASRDAVLSIPKETFYSMTSLGAGTAAMFRSVIIPASLPGILTALRISLGTALSVLFFTETFGTEFGLGYFIMDAWMRVDYVDMFSGILVLSNMGLLLFILLDII
ncbi:MAG TPA: ABC transporter permease subunit, partial [Ignavibacteriales bacterium]|nr:ABC transporter permease subunit [Ignavibacteriales bacterium]